MHNMISFRNVSKRKDENPMKENNIQENKTETEIQNQPQDQIREAETDAEGMEASSEEAPACCCRKVKERAPQESRDLINRLNRIEGQVRGIRGMVEKDIYCADILVQVAAVNAALNSFNKVLLANHIKTCVTRDIREGKEETVDELVALLQKLMK